MRKSDNITSLELLAASQWGMFTTAQAQELGIRRNQISRMANTLRVEPVCYGVYRFVAGAQTKNEDIKAEWLSVSPKRTAHERLSLRPYDAVLAGRTAAYALGAGDFLPSPYTFIVRTRKQTTRIDIRFLQCKLDESDVVLTDEVPTTSYERTVFDLLRLGEDPDLVDKFMQDAAQKNNHSFDIERLGLLLSPIASRYGYESGNGRRFANELTARNTFSVHFEKATKEIGRILAEFNDEIPTSSIKQFKEILDAKLKGGDDGENL